MDLETVIYDKHEHIATITLNRPDSDNAINNEMRSELNQVWIDFRDDDDMWVAVLTGNGPAFCVGLDRAERRLGGPTTPTLSERDEGVRVITSKHLTCWKPVVCAVNGDCVGGALHFIADSDIVICSENATFYDRHPEGGAAAIWEPIQLARKIPYEIALRMMLMGSYERLGAERAYQVGLVSQVVPLKDLVSTATEIAQTVSKNDIYTLMGTVEALYKGQEVGMLQGVRQGLLIRQLQQYKKRLSEPD
jgi:E-phenylitaconyl-CoA hydratase